MDESRLKEAIATELNEVLNLQKRLLSMDENEYDDAIKYIINNFSHDKKSMVQLLYTLKSIVIARPYLLKFASSVIRNICVEVVTFFSSDELLQIFNNKTLLLTIFDIGAVSMEEIMQKYDNNNAFKFFFEQIQATDNEYFSKKIDSTPFLFYFCQKVDYKLHQACQIEGVNNDRIALSIRFDDISNFEYLARSKSFDSRIVYSIYDSNEIVSNMWKMPTYLEYAAFYGAEKIFNYILSIYQINEVEIEESVMEFAVAGGSKEIIQILEEHNVKFNHQCLINAIKYFHLDLYKYILPKIPTSDNDRWQHNILFECINSYNIESIIETFTLDGLNLRNEEKETIFHVISRLGYLDLFNFLIEKDPNLNINDRELLKRTPLLLSVLNNHIDIVKTLVNHRDIDINAEDALYQNSLHYAATLSNIEMYKFLKDKVKEKPDIQGNLVVHTAVINGNLNLLEYLLEEDFQRVHLKNSQGKTIFHLAAENGRLKIVKYLIYIFADEGNDYFNLKDYNGQSALHIASSAGKLDIVEFLSNNEHIELNITDKNGVLIILFIRLLFI